VDTKELQKQLQLARVRAAAAAAEAKSTAKLVVAEKTLAVAETELEVSRELRERGTVTKADHRRQGLLRDRAVGEIAVVNLERLVLEFELQVRNAEVDIALEAIERRKVRTPLEGVVVNLHRRVGEWVQPGDPVAEIVRLDKLVIEGMLSAENGTPEKLIGQTATISVYRGGEYVKAKGKIVFVTPIVEATGELRIRAEFDNRRIDGSWFFRPGQQATLSIETK
jgi:multidrug resistance efflux pump